jgi:hypothetical protein
VEGASCSLMGIWSPAVGGHGGYPGGKQFLSAEQLREKLSYLRHEKALIVKLVPGEAVVPPSEKALIVKLVATSKRHLISPHGTWMMTDFYAHFSLMQVDIVDFNGSFLARVRDFAGAFLS